MNEEYVVDNVEANEKLEAEIVQEENQQDKKPITEYAFNNKIEKSFKSFFLHFNP